MEYKERNFTIERKWISFQGTFIPHVIIVSTLTILLANGFYLSHDKAALATYLFLSLGFIVFFFHLFRIFFNPRFRLSEIAYIEVQELSTKLRGTDRFWNFAPAGIDKNKGGKLLRIFRKGKKFVICFVPENYVQTIRSLKENGVKIIEN